ncbi:conserved hypothetical protein [Thiomonas sp. X19]|uniref:PIN domain-containing protein n=1 Tax=Thiomonas sp. X19 TaxID=1050370 RepID=UPI000B65C51C|nr:type II toxin-antitoxin system VapC family toxin [Thiomonas sp. X19]SCC95530.1 conserved hypothetical protein [Thiomonas sp. X19]
MIGLDTNILVRYLTQDDARQSALASKFIEQSLSASQPGFVSLVVLAELCWVLQRLYGVTPNELADLIADLSNTPRFVLEQRTAVQATLTHFRGLKSRKSGLVDVLIAQRAAAEGCSQTVTFDKAAVRAGGMALLA